MGNTHINTGGGGVVQESVEAGRDFIGRDKIEAHIYMQPTIDLKLLQIKKDMLDRVIDRIRRERQNFVILSKNEPRRYKSHLHQRAVEEYSWTSLKEDIEHLHRSEMTPDAGLTSRLLQAIDDRDAKSVLNLCDELNGKLHIAIKQIPF